MAYLKDSAILVIKATENGYVIELAQWGQSPPPIAYRDLERDSNPGPTVRVDYNADNKVDLKAKLALWVDSLFDQ